MLMLQIVLISRFSIQVKIVIDLENSDGCKWIFIVLNAAAAAAAACIVFMWVRGCVECAF